MSYKLNDFHAYRFYEKKEGPLVTIRQYSSEEVSDIGFKAGIVNINEIYNNRIMIENLLFQLFVNKGGKPQLTYPYYAAVYEKLPENNQLYIRFSEPELIKIPMSAFSKEHVSFTFGRSTKAFTRKDSHPTRRKLLMWDEAEMVINQFPFNEEDELWLEMQIWDDTVICQHYNDGKGVNIKAIDVENRLSNVERNLLKKKYERFLDLIKEEYFFDPKSIHGVSHAIRVLILSQELAELYHLDTYYKQILVYCSVFHDIGRDNHGKDNEHGFKSYNKMIELNLIPEFYDSSSHQLIRFIVENHQLDHEVAKRNLANYPVKDKEVAYQVYCILKDADTLDRCRFGHIVQSYLSNDAPRCMIYFAYQLLTIYR